MVVVLVELAGHAIQRNGLVEQLIACSALNLNRQVVPCIVNRIARDACRNPVSGDIVPDVPFVAACNAAFVTPDKADVVKKLIDVEFNGLRQFQVGSVKINVVSKFAVGGNQSLIVVGQALRRKWPNEMVIKERVGVNRRPSNVVLRGGAAHRWRGNSLLHGEVDSIARRRRTVYKIGWTLPGSAPTAALLHIRK